MLDKLVVLALTAPARMGKWISNQSGQDIMEYALLGGFIAVAFAVAAVATPLKTYMANFVNVVAGCVAMNNTTCKIP